MVVALVALGLLLPACHKSDPSCSGDLQPYKGACVNQAAIVLFTCTENRGMNTTTEVSGGVGGSFKVVADATLKAAYKKSKQENTPVALQIVKDCMEIAKSSAESGADRAVAQSYETRARKSLEQWQKEQVAATPHIRLSRSRAGTGETVIVTGTGFWPNETVDIDLQASLLAQVPADGRGAFRAEVTVPEGAPPPDFSTTITATGETSAKHAQAPFNTT